MHTIPSSVINVFILASGQYVFTVLNSKVNVTSSSLLEIIQATGHPTQYYVVLTSYNIATVSYTIVKFICNHQCC